MLKPKNTLKIILIIISVIILLLIIIVYFIYLKKRSNDNKENKNNKKYGTPLEIENSSNTVEREKSIYIQVNNTISNLKLKDDSRVETNTDTDTAEIINNPTSNNTKDISTTDDITSTLPSTKNYNGHSNNPKNINNNDKKSIKFSKIIIKQSGKFFYILFLFFLI